MDLAKYDTKTGSEEGRWFEPIGLDGKPLGMRIKLMGPDSRRYAELKGEVQREAYEAIAAAANGETVKQSKKTDAEKEVDFYSKLTMDWEPTGDDPVTWEGKPFPFTEANARKLYEMVPMVRNQVRVYIEGRRNFTPPGGAA